jgi:hypothetical protein
MTILISKLIQVENTLSYRPILVCMYVVRKCGIFPTEDLTVMAVSQLRSTA